MSESLDALAARAVYAAGLFERALHDVGPWEITWGPHTEVAQRTLGEDGITFSARFPDTCYLHPPEPNAVLRCRGEVMAVREISFPGDSSFAVTWALRARVLAHEVA